MPTISNNWRHKNIKGNWFEEGRKFTALENFSKKKGGKFTMIAGDCDNNITYLFRGQEVSDKENKEKRQGRKPNVKRKNPLPFLYF